MPDEGDAAGFVGIVGSKAVDGLVNTASSRPLVMCGFLGRVCAFQILSTPILVFIFKYRFTILVVLLLA